MKFYIILKEKYTIDLLQQLIMLEQVGKQDIEFENLQVAKETMI